MDNNNSNKVVDTLEEEEKVEVEVETLDNQPNNISESTSTLAQIEDDRWGGV